MTWAGDGAASVTEQASERVREIAGGVKMAGEVTFRNELRPGDIGWVIKRNGEVYAEKYGWGIEFEALAAEIAAKIVQQFDPRWERCWLAELDGERVGCVFVVKQSET